MVHEKSSAETQPATSAGTSTGLVICRNKHWKYISSFHGPWLQLPIEILESLAHQNWTMPSPRLIDPAVFFDILKIRKYVDEAAYDSVRASTGISNTAMSGRMDYFGAGGGPSSQLSKERIFKIRQKATTMLAKAFTIDEVAASVATMQATSTVEDVGQHVLKRDHNNNSAKYVHFFQEKIPSRAVEQHTSVMTLTEILSRTPWEEQAALLRTRALAHAIKKEYEDAAVDLTYALRIVGELKSVHKPDQQQLELASRMQEQQEAWQKGFKDWRSVPHLKEDDQPQSLEGQLLFNRANVYLALACQSINAALDGLKDFQDAEMRNELSPKDHEAQLIRLEARKRVKTNAKRAIKDYLGFLSRFEYTPGLPYDVTNEIMRRIHDLSHGTRPQRQLEETANTGSNGTALVKGTTNGESTWPKFPLPKIYPVSTLFADRPPPDLPQYPESNNDHSTNILKEALGSREVVSYHPLLIEALNSLLLAHTLLQTSTTELQRHAYNVARLSRIADGYPVFQPSRSPAKADWGEILVKNKNWLNLAGSWSDLCVSAPLPDAAGGWAKEGTVAKTKQVSAESEQRKQRRQKHENILEALSDDRVVDEETFQQAVRARQERAQRQADDAAAGVPSISARAGDGGALNDKAHTKPRESLADGFVISTERAQHVMRWIFEAPASMGARKKRSARKKKPTGQHVAPLTESVSTLSVDNDDMVD